MALKTGEIVTLCNLTPPFNYANGVEVVIIECLGPFTWPDGIEGTAYAVKAYFHISPIIVNRNCLCSNRPSTELSTWDQVNKLTNWKPEEVD